MQEVFEKIIGKLEEQAEECRKIWNEFDDEEPFGAMNAYTNAIEIVKQAAEEYNNGWILCIERLPNKEEFLKAYIRNKYGAEFIVMIEGANRPTTLYLTSDGLRVDDCRNVHEVIAWQPLPEPYQPKGE